MFGAGGPERQAISPPNKTMLLPHVQPAIGRGLAVQEVFPRFQNLNLRVLIDDLQRGRVAHGEWQFADDLCPVAHGLVGGQRVNAIRYLTQAMDLPRRAGVRPMTWACRQAPSNALSPFGMRAA